MQEANPELVEQLKSAFKKPGDENQDGNPDKGQSWGHYLITMSQKWKCNTFLTLEHSLFYMISIKLCLQMPILYNRSFLWK